MGYMNTAKQTHPKARHADTDVAAAPNFADAMSTLEAALAAGVPIADLLAAQAQR